MKNEEYELDLFIWKNSTGNTQAKLRNPDSSFFILHSSFCAQRTKRQFINKWNPSQKIRPQIRDSRSFCNALTVRALQKSKKNDGLFSPETPEKTPEKHWYCEVKAWILRGNNLVIAGW